MFTNIIVVAPEVTRMQGITSSCDIWSLGCTIIELLTGAPPYFELNTAQALYKIVTDDHPPLPEGLSKGLEDVLLRCFQKDEKIRYVFRQ
jgi:serine/threonine protein kinase